MLTSMCFDHMYITCLCSVSVSEGKRASGLTAVWVARNRFAVLDRTHNVSYIHLDYCALKSRMAFFNNCCE